MKINNLLEQTGIAGKATFVMKLLKNKKKIKKFGKNIFLQKVSGGVAGRMKRLRGPHAARGP